MKSRCRSLLVPALAAGVLVASLGAPAYAASAAPRPPDGAPKTHALYVGADISIQFHGQLYPVTDVKGEALIIRVDGKPVPVPLAGNPVTVKIVDQLRLGPNDIVLADLQAERAYTLANDPREKFLNSPAPGLTGADAANAQIGYDATMNNLPRDPAAAVNAMAKASRNLSQAQNNQRSDADYAGHWAQQLQRDLDQALYDAMKITFTVSARYRLNHPYIIGVAQVREKDAPPGQVRRWIVAKGFDAIGPEDQRVRILEGGLPPGFTLESFRLHLYDAGVEYPTAASAKRVPLTRDEAFQYLMLEYRAAYPGATLPPSPAVAELPDDFRARLESGALRSTYHVRVRPDGTPGPAFLDSGCTEPVTDPYVNAVIAGTRFKPALEKGQPAEGVATLTLAQLAR